MECCDRKTYEPVREKTNNLGSDQVQHKTACTITEDGLKLEILDLRRTAIASASLFSHMQIVGLLVQRLISIWQQPTVMRLLIHCNAKSVQLPNCRISFCPVLCDVASICFVRILLHHMYTGWF